MALDVNIKNDLGTGDGSDEFEKKLNEELQKIFDPDHHDAPRYDEEGLTDYKTKFDNRMFSWQKKISNTLNKETK
jgi:hypothetical protein